MSMKTAFFGFLAASIVFTGVMIQEPRWPGIYFSATGANTADASIVRTTVSDESVLNITLSDTSTVHQLRNDKADTYYPLTNPDGDISGGHWLHPAIGAADTVTTTTDNAMLCQVLYLPMWLNATVVDVLGVVGTDSGTDETLAFAIYENADAGVQLTEGVGADLTTTALVAINITDVVLGPGMYRMCACAQDISGAAFHATTLDDESIDVMNAVAVTFGTSANACVTGNPPDTTGALTTADDASPVFKIRGG